MRHGLASIFWCRWLMAGLLALVLSPAAAPGQAPQWEALMLAETLLVLGDLALRQGQPAKAEPLLRRALAVSEKSLGGEHPQVARAVASIATGNRAHVVTLTNDNRHAWVCNIGDNNISIVDTKSFRILGTIPVGKGPTGLAFSRDGQFAYVSNQGDKTVEVIETASHRIIKTIPVGANPHFLVLGPDGRIWGTNTGGTDIYVIDPGRQDKVASLNVGPAPQQIAFGFKGLQGPNAYVTVGGLNKIVVVSADVKALRILEQIDVGQRPNGVWANREGTRVYAVHEVSNDLRVLDTGTSQVIATVPVGRKPIRVVYHGG